jgi:glutamine cyclotransferase
MASSLAGTRHDAAAGRVRRCQKSSGRRGRCGGRGSRGRVPVSGYRVVASFPHDSRAFTQGLVYAGGELYEGTGLYGQSTLRRVALASGEVRQSAALDPRLFGEGIAIIADRVYQLTWKERVCLVYERETFQRLNTLRYETEGWGLASHGGRLIMSDGSSRLVWRDPESFAALGAIDVRAGRKPVGLLNELEVVDGEIWANIWQRDRIARIDPETGNVVGWIDLSGLLPAEDRRQADVLNGIAHDPGRDRLFVTGKLWPTLFAIEIVSRTG